MVHVSKHRGREFKERIKRVLASDTWPRMPDELRLDEIKKQRSKAFKSARNAASRRPDFKSRLAEEKRQAAFDRELLPGQAPAPSPGVVIRSEEELFR